MLLDSSSMPIVSCTAVTAPNKYVVDATTYICLVWGQRDGHPMVFVSSRFHNITPESAAKAFRHGAVVLVQ